MHAGLDYKLLTNLALVVVIIMSTAAALHAIVYKRNPRSAFSWVGLILVWPLVGAIFYYFFGINRISKRILTRKAINKRVFLDARVLVRVDEQYISRQKYKAILTCSDNLGCPPLAFATIDLNYTGGEAYEHMLKAINDAHISISLCSYIFAMDEVGEMFIDALTRAQARGVAIRVLIDAVGSSKGARQVLSRLKKSGVKSASFLSVIWRSNLSNMRNHRKLLIIDGEEAFTGGLNIAKIYWPEKAGKDAVIDFNYRLKGDIVYHLQEVFADDWLFATGETLDGEQWFRPSSSIDMDKAVLIRLIVAGPVFQQERVHWHFLNAINIAENHLRIATPYFLPDDSIMSALCSAALRGVCVEILIPKHIDHALMNWALQGSLFELLIKGCQVYRSYPHFDHSKFLIVDDDYASVGSANWDARSLRLNFELNMGVINQTLVADLIGMFETKKAQSTLYKIKDLNNRNYFEKIRDGAARLLTPYL